MKVKEKGKKYGFGSQCCQMVMKPVGHTTEDCGWDSLGPRPRGVVPMKGQEKEIEGSYWSSRKLEE